MTWVASTKHGPRLQFKLACFTIFAAKTARIQLRLENLFVGRGLKEEEKRLEVSKSN